MLDGQRSKKSRLNKGDGSTAKDLASGAPSIISVIESDLDTKTEAKKGNHMKLGSFMKNPMMRVRLANGISMNNALGELVAMSDAMPRKSSRQLTI